MDTREKIIPVEQLAERLTHGEWLAVVGTFDPLTLSQAERLAAAAGNGKSVLAVVEPDAHSLLPVEARAILVAALKSVQLVTISSASGLPKLARLVIATDATGERARSQAFVEHVRGRQSAR